VRETPENALALANLRNACRGARRRSVPALAAALALLAKLAPEEEAGEAGVSAAARAATLNELAAVKRDLVDWLGRCRSIGIEEAEAETRDEKAGGAEEEAEVSFRASPSGDRRDDSGALVVAVPRPHGVVDVAGGDSAGGTSETPETPGGGSALDDLLERARRRQRGARARATSARGPRAPFWMARRPAAGSGASAAAGLAGSPSSAAPGSAAARARRLFASREASAHNASVMRELGESGVERRDGVTGFGDAVRRRDEARAGEDAARALAEREARDAKRRRNEPTPQQRIQAKLNQMKRGKRR
jgi:hypothetical protein